jgi:hypothetical protein
MATATLVDRDVDIGRKILLVLVQANVPVNVAFWAYVSQISEWQFFIATPLVDSKGHKAAYEQVLRALHDAGMDPQLPWRRIFLRSPKDPVLRSLEKQTETPNGWIEIVEYGNIPKGTPNRYYVTYASYPSETYRILNEAVGDRFVEDAYVYGKMWIVPGFDNLREFLSRSFHLKPSTVESALEALSSQKSASIPEVRLQPRDLKRLRPA